MKLKKYIIPVLLLGLASCGSTPNSSSVSVESTGSFVSSTPVCTSTNLICDWTAATKTAMNDIIGEILPVAPFTQSYTLDVGEDYFSIEDTVPNIKDAYSALLEAAGYIYDYSSNLEEDFIYMDAYVKPITETESILIELYRFEDENLSSIFGSIEDTTSLELLTKWPEEIETLMNKTIGEVLPLAPFTNYYYFDELASTSFYIGDYVGNILEPYGILLESAGYEYDATYDSDDFHYAVYSKIISGGDIIVVHVIFDVETNCAEIEAWIE